MQKEALYKQQLVELGMLREEEKQTFKRQTETQVLNIHTLFNHVILQSAWRPVILLRSLIKCWNISTQAAKYRSELEQERLQLQRQHSSDMEQILDKVRGSQTPSQAMPVHREHGAKTWCFGG